MNTIEEKLTESLIQGEKALSALKKFSNNSDKKLLFPDDKTNISLLVTLKKVPLRQKMRRFVAVLPHTDKIKENTSLCLILPDFDQSDEAKRDPDVDAQARRWSNILRKKHNLTGADIAKIYTYNQLVREVSQIPDKAKLSNTYDIFLVEAKLMKKVLSFLGCKFRTAAKTPLPIHVNNKNFPDVLKRAYSTVNIPTYELKDNATIHFGNLTQSNEHLIENLKTVIKKYFDCCAGGHNNVRSMYLKTDCVRMALPIFVDFGSPNDIKFGRSKIKRSKTVIDDCSALPENLVVKVNANGEVFVLDKNTKKKVVYPTIDDEWEKNDDLKPASVNKALRKRKNVTAMLKIRKKRKVKTE